MKREFLAHLLNSPNRRPAEKTSARGPSPGTPGSVSLRSRHPGFVFLALLAALFAGCVSKSKADAQARMAYLAGQRDAMLQMQHQARRGPFVTFIGPVNNPVVGWMQGLTLSQAIVKAVYNLSADPTNIVIHRNSQDVTVDPTHLLAGQDVPLQPGDVVEIR